MQKKKLFIVVYSAAGGAGCTYFSNTFTSKPIEEWIISNRSKTLINYIPITETQYRKLNAAALNDEPNN
jgi:hypothetical protein